MSEANEDQLLIAHSFNPELKPNDVALIFRSDGEPEIHHNIPSLAETGKLQAGTNAAGIMLALAMVNIATQDENAMSAALTRVAMLLEGGKLRLVH